MSNFSVSSAGNREDSCASPKTPRKIVSRDMTQAKNSSSFPSPNSLLSSPDFNLAAYRHRFTPERDNGSYLSPSHRSRSPFARASRRHAKKASEANSTRISPTSSRAGSPKRNGVEESRWSSLLDSLDELSADLGEFLDQNFVEILYGVAIAMLLVVLVTSIVARAYMPPYRGWDSERRIYIAATRYSGAGLIFLLIVPVLYGCQFRYKSHVFLPVFHIWSSVSSPYSYTLPKPHN
uniref:Uncharacterized protein n=1 Tax=Tetraselmis sp. GSL018 TaxID=582737 RepID=A0A061RYR1_9CHLO|mmetsp:Transcript_6365/g.15294  ORF Transcript_6365/g.15294 Transcript_6365/m.15294 type:complete len:236 (+) Transcript_6365:146-853(+)